MEHDLQYVKGALEALLFVSDKPVMMEQFKDVLEGIDTKIIRQALEALKGEYDQRQSGMVISEIAGGYQMLSSPQYAVSIRAFYRTQKKEKLSKPALETLAIVAYKQPVTRVDVEMIRGVNSDGVVNHLLEKNLIKITGRKDVPGKPYEHGTTKEFLEYFGLRSLLDLPKLEEFNTAEGQTHKIEAFQQVSEQFREQASENAPQEAFQGALDVPPESGGVEDPEAQARAENDITQNDNTGSEDTSKAQSEDAEFELLTEQDSIKEGGNHDHPQAS